MSGYEEEAGGATSRPASSIQAISKGVVHQLCSAQVVLSLATAVKELVENSVDAGATQVEVKLTEQVILLLVGLLTPHAPLLSQGAQTVEVADNGCGVSEENLAGLTVKHATSKLREFTDLMQVETFGFRGEALSSLCALASVTISTRHTSAKIGTVMTYDHDGKEIERRLEARPCGTTVTLHNMFGPMPVRQREFLRNIKKELSKLVGVVSAYALVPGQGLRLSLSNSVKGKRSVLVQTRGSVRLQDNIVAVFGAKQMSSLRPFSQIQLTQEHLASAGIRVATVPSIKLEGYISSCVHGEGRGAMDRQFFFVNSRPTDNVKLAKLVNQVYHGYNRSQFPFVCLNIVTARSETDVNLTPDKRQILLANQRILHELLKLSLEAMYADSPSVVYSIADQSTKAPVEAGDKEEYAIQKYSDTGVDFTSLKRRFSDLQDKSEEVKANKKQKSMTNYFNSTSDSERNISSGMKTSTEIESPISGVLVVELENETNNVKEVNDNDLNKENKEPTAESFIETPSAEDPSQSLEAKVESTSSPVTDHSNQEMHNSGASSQPSIMFDSLDNLKQDDPELKPLLSNSSGLTPSFEDASRRISVHFDTISTKPSLVSYSDSSGLYISPSKTLMNGSSKIIFESPSQEFNQVFNNKELKPNIPNLSRTESFETATSDENVTEVDVTYVDDDIKHEKRVVDLAFNMDRLTVRTGATLLKSQENKLKFSARIKASDNKSAESELDRQISKSDFARMQIYGQFNLGFLIVGLEEDLFIVDQHASDEKYNFETLQKTTKIKSQRMIVPQKLELTAVNESILIDNLEVFEKNGFQFLVWPEAEVTKRVELTHLPLSKNWTFGPDDIQELIFLLECGAGDQGPCRPSRVRAMFASRACRNAVMIGTSLSRSDMHRLIRHMGEIEQPWNCPHGRPTIRHLVNTSHAR